MQTTITVEATTKESKQAQGKTYWGVKQGDNWYNLITSQKPAKGQRYNVEVKETEYNGRTYRWATIVQAQQAPSSAPVASNGHIPWDDYAHMLRVAHALARDLEPDETGTVARAAICNTVMIAFSNGKVALPKEDEPPPFEDDGSIPF